MENDSSERKVIHEIVNAFSREGWSYEKSINFLDVVGMELNKLAKREKVKDH